MLTWTWFVIFSNFKTVTFISFSLKCEIWKQLQNLISLSVYFQLIICFYFVPYTVARSKNLILQYFRLFQIMLNLLILALLPFQNSAMPLKEGINSAKLWDFCYIWQLCCTDPTSFLNFSLFTGKFLYHLQYVPTDCIGYIFLLHTLFV